MYVWSEIPGTKVHLLDADARTICRVENNGPQVASRYEFFGEAVPKGRDLCGACRYLRKQHRGLSHGDVTTASLVGSSQAASAPTTGTAPVAVDRPAEAAMPGTRITKPASARIKPPPHPDDDQHDRLMAQRVYESDRLAMSRHFRRARAEHRRVLSSLRRLPRRIHSEGISPKNRAPL
jgi:hypothetical protein